MSSTSGYRERVWVLSFWSLRQCQPHMNNNFSNGIYDCWCPAEQCVHNVEVTYWIVLLDPGKYMILPHLDIDLLVDLDALKNEEQRHHLASDMMLAQTMTDTSFCFLKTPWISTKISVAFLTRIWTFWLLCLVLMVKSFSSMKRIGPHVPDLRHLRRTWPQCSHLAFEASLRNCNWTRLKGNSLRSSLQILNILGKLTPSSLAKKSRNEKN